MTSERGAVEAAGWRMSTRLAAPDGRAPLATILALPGGGFDSQYWDHPRCPEASLPVLGARLGFQVVALDRPGYGMSQPRRGDGVSLAEQTDVILALVERLAQGAGTFLIGHSLGGILALTAASLGRSPKLLGIDVSGVPFRYSSTLQTAVDAAIEQRPAASKGRSPAAIFYGPDGAFDPALLRADDPAMTAPPIVELDESRSWPTRFAAVAGAITVPVRYTLGADEQVTPTGRETLDQVSRLFAAAPFVEAHLQGEAGHNISLHRVGRAYHLHALAFFTDVLARRGAGRG